MYSLKIQNAEGKTLAEENGENEAGLVYRAAYTEGDKIVLEVSEKNTWCVLQLDDALGEALVYVTGNVDYVVPFGEKRVCYSPKVFSGERHYLHVRSAREYEISAYRNLAINVCDQHGDHNCYPHATANVETRGESVFAARNAIDGVCENRSHGSWPYESWGINMQDDAEMTVDLGVTAEVDRIVLYTRSDFPHDNWWKRVTLEFSDGTRLVEELEKSSEPHVIEFESKKISSVTLKELIKADDPSPFPALSQIQIFGHI